MPIVSVEFNYKFSAWDICVNAELTTYYMLQVSLVDRIERMDAERKALSDDIKDIYAEAKSAGFDVPVLRQVVARRKKERDAIHAETCRFRICSRA